MSAKELKDKNNQTEFSGHRKRLKSRFEKSGFDGFNDYEILELLLTYAIPRKDTKPVAKALIKKFKSIPKVLDASVEDLKSVEGLGVNAALFINILRETIAKYFSSMYIEQKAFLRLEELVDYLRATIGGKSNEVIQVIYLNSKNELIAAEDLGEGTVSEAVAFPRKIVESALKHKATSVIIAHNHPGGLAEPSEHDNSITKSIQDALKIVGIDLQEHVIIADDKFYSYRKNGYFDNA